MNCAYNGLRHENLTNEKHKYAMINQHEMQAFVPKSFLMKTHATIISNCKDKTFFLDFTDLCSIFYRVPVEFHLITEAENYLAYVFPTAKEGNLMRADIKVARG